MSESKATAGIEVQCVACSQPMAYEIKRDSCVCPACSNELSRETALLDFVRTLMSKTFQFRREDIHPDSQLNEIGDSLGTIEMLMKLENEFGIMIGHEDIEELETVQEVARYIDARLAAS